MKNTKETGLHTKRIQAHMNSQRLRQNALSLHRSVPVEVLELKGEADTCPILYPEIISKWQPLANENLSFSRGFSGRNKLLLLHAKQEIANTKETPRASLEVPCLIMLCQGFIFLNYIYFFCPTCLLCITDRASFIPFTSKATLFYFILHPFSYCS